MSRELAAIKIRVPAIPVVFNCSATFLSEPAAIKEALIKQVSRAVQWENSIGCLLKRGYDTFLEVGPGIPAGFMKRSHPPAIAPRSVISPLNKVKAELKEVCQCR